MTAHARTGEAPHFGQDIAAKLDALARCTDVEGTITRLYLSPAHRGAADLVVQWMRDAGMTTRIDAAGGVVGRYESAGGEAERAAARVLIIGSHIDSVPNAGRFDGNLGVATAIAAVKALAGRGQRLPFAIEVVAFGDEEGTRFPSTLGGSRALAGVFNPAILDERDGEGLTRREALVAFGCDPDAIAGEARDPARHIGYVEVHIEQGPVLEAESLPVGVVAAINGASRGVIDIGGEAGHAGTVPMAMRRDALAAAAEMVLAIEARALREDDLVATVGRVEIENAAVNSIPGLVRLSLDIRSPSDARRANALHDIRDALRRIAERRGVTARLEMGYEALATPCDTGLSRVMSEAIASLGIGTRMLASGAGHDAMSFRGRLPVAMMFVRCRGGISHSPLEHASVEDMDVAARALIAFVERLASDPSALA